METIILSERFDFKEIEKSIRQSLLDSNANSIIESEYIHIAPLPESEGVFSFIRVVYKPENYIDDFSMMAFCMIQIQDQTITSNILSDSAAEALVDIEIYCRNKVQSEFRTKLLNETNSFTIYPAEFSRETIRKAVKAKISRYLLKNK